MRFSSSKDNLKCPFRTCTLILEGYSNLEMRRKANYYIRILFFSARFVKPMRKLDSSFSIQGWKARLMDKHLKKFKNWRICGKKKCKLSKRNPNRSKSIIFSRRWINCRTVKVNWQVIRAAINNNTPVRTSLFDL